MKRILIATFLIGFPLVAIAQDQTAPKKKKKPAPFQWVNPLPAKHEQLIRHGTFVSPSMGVEVGYNVYFPPAYAESSRRFPVVYYLHGGRPGSESKSLGLVELIDRSIRRSGKLGAIYVFVNGGPVSHYNMPDDPGAQGASVFIKELIPHVDATYRTIAESKGRAIEGFSQGGRGTMRLSLRHPDLFCSAAPGGGGYATEKRISESNGAESESLVFAPGDNVYDLAVRYRDLVRSGRAQPLPWLIHVGTKGFNYENNLAYMKFLDEQEIAYQKIIVEGAKHSAREIYEQSGDDIVLFHLTNFGQ
ncbi:MAG: alpha/beta hydrolase-fold protein [Planctomycetota bacterium]